LKVNREIRAAKVRLISHTGEQVGIVSLHEALEMADQNGLDLVEVVPGSTPPVCKIMNFGKFRYDQSKREKESKKASHQIKVKEIKLKPNIDVHDLETKIRHAREFLMSGNKVKITCLFRGREMMRPELGEKVVREMCQQLEEISMMESPPKMMGRMLLAVLAPGGVKKKKESGKGIGGTGEASKSPSPSE
jgi:translation initiation factor IF-3